MMTRFTTLFFMVILILGPFCSRSKATEGTSNELRTFVDHAVKELNSASFKIPQFKTATVDTIEDQGKIDGVNLYLCWLKSNQGRVGYISLIGGEGSYQIVSISATTADPNYFLKHLQVRKLKERPLRLSQTTQLSFVPDVPLVAATPTTFALQPVELSETACCLTGVLHYLQYKEHPALFDSNGMYGNWGYHWFLRQHSIEQNQKNMVQINETLKKIMAEKKKAGWRSFTEELKEAFGGENTEPGDTSEEWVAYMVRMRSIAVPILRRRLLNPATMLERLELIPYEEAQIHKLTHRAISRGMRNTSRGIKDAILIQEDYLKPDTAKLEQGIDMFFRTRGIKAEISFLPFKEMPPDLLPSILVGPDESAGLLLGYIDIDGESFAFIFFPKTGKPIIMSLADKKRKRGSKSLITDADIENASNEEMRKRLSRIKAMDEKTIFVEDRIGELPGSLEYGVHLVRCSGLASWHGLYIGKIVAGENWGVFPLKELKEKSK